MPWIQISKAEVQQLAHFFCCLLMYFYEVIHLSLNRCVKKTANTEARWCHILHEESLTLCLLSVFKSPSAWFTQKLLKLLFLLGMAFLVNLWLFFFSFFDLFLQLCNIKSSLNSIRDTKFVAQLLKASPPPPQAHSPSCRQSRASGFISSKADISRLVCSVHCRQYWLTRPLCEPVGIGMVQATFWATRLLSCYCVNYLNLWD